MYEFATFNPIEKTIKKDVLDYLNENNLSLPDNPIIKDYFSLPEAPDMEFDNPFFAGKNTGSKTKKTPVKQNLPRFTIPAISKEQPGTYNQLKEDETIPSLVEKSKGITEDKKRFTAEIDSLNISDEDKEYITKLADKESSFRPHVTNQLGYFGYYQFGNTALKDVGFSKEDMKNTINQHIAALKFKHKNLEPFKDFVGQTVNGIKLTRNNLAAAAHLAGASGLKDWIKGTKTTSFAKRGFVDANGTHITKYLKDFA